VQVDVELRALQESGEPEAELDMVLSDPAGAPLLEVRGLRLRGLASHEALCRHDDGERESLAPSEHTPAERAFLRMIDSGIRESEGMAALDRVLASPQQAVVHVSSMDLDGLLRLQDRASEAWETGASEVRFERPALASAYVAPRNAIERRLVQWWQELLGVDQVGVHDEFFELGGHSLIAVRLFSRIKQEFGVEHPLSVLFEAPTIAAYAALLAEDLGVDAAKLDDDTAQDDAAPARMRRRHRYLVPMNDVRESTAPPFFLVAGMFGNVLNLRHLAMHLGEDRQVYAIQAAGLREEEVPHRRFEDMASAYLEEIRAVQPHGPYLLGGFSGGGITAFEMAQQLRAAGEETAALVLLDTPIPRQPEANWKDRARIFSTRVREEGPTYPFRWIKRRVAWEWQRRRRRSSQDRAGTPAEFRSELVKDAFLEAVEHYELQPYPGLLTLFRPKLMRRFELAGGRWTNEFREIQDVCNHWLPYAAGGIDTYEVDGDHDSMVLEPHVRVLGPRMRESLVEAMQEWRKSQTPSQD
jgi:thioesterase domain-containing protein/acyl carrier protein